MAEFKYSTNPDDYELIGVIGTVRTLARPCRNARTAHALAMRLWVGSASVDHSLAVEQHVTKMMLQVQIRHRACKCRECISVAEFTCNAQHHPYANMALRTCLLIAQHASLTLTANATPATIRPKNDYRDLPTNFTSVHLSH